MKDHHPTRARPARVRYPSEPLPEIDLTAWHKSLDRLSGAYSEHTLKGYEVDFRLFLRWCVARRLPPLPATPITVAAYLGDRMDALKPSTLKRRLSGIRKIHRLYELPDPTDHFEVDLALRRARRRKPQRPSQALGVTAAVRDRLLAVCGDDVVGLRDRVLITVGFDTLCRRGELVALAAEDLEPNAFGNLSILVKRAKNDPYGAGRIAHLTAATVRLVEQWLEVAAIDRGPLLRPVYREHAVPRYLNAAVVGRILKKLAERAGLDAKDVARVSGHSLRVGAAQQLTLNGVQILPIMRAGGWRSFNVVARYVENVEMDVWGKVAGR